jgi:hypothetical protein
MIDKKAKIAIVGGGVAGSTAALYLGELGLDITLFEKEKCLVNGPPFCHLHAGGNLYREISDEQCVTLLGQSIDFLRYYPFIVDYRPTVIVVPTEDKGSSLDLLPRLELLVKEYRKYIAKDPKNEVLGSPETYYKVYEKKDILTLKKKSPAATPKTMDEWMIPVAKNIELDKVQFPLIMVQEYGLNLFRLASGVTLALKALENIMLKTGTEVVHIEKENDKWSVSYRQDDVESEETFDYLVNAAGFQTGHIDDMLGLKCERMVEFKAAYITKCDTKGILWPEVIFHGERGTPQGMGQFTPYPGGHFQLHGMTHDITLFDDGLAVSTSHYAQPKLGSRFIDKIEKGWQADIVQDRTQAAIAHLAHFIPNFSVAKVASKPLYGAQQIPGTDPTLRVAEVSFHLERYARCEIVKVSSVLDMIDAITKELIALEYLDGSVYRSRERKHLEKLDKKALSDYAHQICLAREYPVALSNRNIPRSQT